MMSKGIRFQQIEAKSIMYNKQRGEGGGGKKVVGLKENKDELENGWHMWIH